MSRPPLRLRDPGSEASPLLRACLTEAAPSRSMTPDEVVRLQAALPSGGTLARSTFPARRGWTFAAALALVFAGTTFAYEWFEREPSPAEDTAKEISIPVVETALPAEEPRGASAPSTRVDRPETPAADDIPSRASTTRSSPRRPDALRVPAEAPEDDPLTREIAILRRAQASMASSPSDALRLVQRHGREFPSGQLIVERELLAIEALVRSNRLAAARARAARFEAEPGREAYAPRLRSILEGAVEVPVSAP